MNQKYVYSPLGDYFWVYPGAEGKVVFNRGFVLEVIQFALSASSDQKGEGLAKSYDELKEITGGSLQVLFEQDQCLRASLRAFITELISARNMFEINQELPKDLVYRRIVTYLNLEVFLEICSAVDVTLSLRKPPRSVRLTNSEKRRGWWSRSIRSA